MDGGVIFPSIVGVLHRLNSERTVSFASNIPSKDFILPRQCIRHTMKLCSFSEETQAVSVGYSHRGIWSVCCVAGGGDGQTISEAGAVTGGKNTLCSE